MIEKVEVGKGYKVTVHLRMSYAQFLGIEEMAKYKCGRTFVRDALSSDKREENPCKSINI